ncbi:MAG: divalent-cation tolerance protein CutA [Candidatus Omnitrophica bacterium]|nr:divalent-cation tolerance protein CutA [Candidatus Omnitrophota bacterium]
MTKKAVIPADFVSPKADSKQESMHCIVIITCPSQKDAGRIKDLLLENRLVACVNIIKGVRSFFWWKGTIDSASEVMLLAKTTRAKFKKIAACVTKVHPYDVPEIITIPIMDGNKPYLNWIDDSLKSL